MAAQHGDAPIQVGRQLKLQLRRLAALGNTAVEGAMREADDPVDEITEDISEVLVHIDYEADQREVGIRTLRRVGDQPPAPKIRWQLFDGRVSEHPTLCTGREFTAFIGEPVKAFDDVDRLPGLSRSE